MFLLIDNVWNTKHHTKIRKGNLQNEDNITSCNAIVEFVFFRQK